VSIQPGLDSAAPSSPAPTLREVSREVSRIAARLERLAEAEALGRRFPQPEAAIDSGLVRSVIAARRLRAEMVGLGPADPAWSLMLELFALRLEQGRVTLTALGVAAGVAPTTALRWTEALCADGICVRRRDPARSRYIFIDLSDDAAARMHEHLSAALGIAFF